MNLAKLIAKLCLFLVVFSSFQGVLLFNPNPVQAGELGSVSVTLSNPRLSYYANQYGTTALSSFVKIAATGDPGTGPSKTNDNIFPNDTLLIGPGNSAAAYIVEDASSSAANSIQLTTALAAGDNSGIAIASRSSILSTALTTTSQIPNGYFRFRVKAGALTATNADGIPDQTGFDFSKTTPTVTCPNNTTGYTFSAGTATASAGTYCPSGYHCFECPYSGNGAVGTAFTSAGVGPFLLNANHAMINPAPAGNHTLGIADSYKVIVEHLDSSHAVRDVTTIAMAINESVRITATVEPILNFTIGGLNAGTYCGTAAGTIDTTATNVPFGTLTISNFLDAAQSLTVATNALNGYVVVASSSGALSIGGDGVTTIADTTCNNGGCTATTAQEWSNSTHKGFGYSIAPNTCTGTCSVNFSYNSCVSGGYGNFCSRPFQSAYTGTWPTLYSGTTVANSDSIYVCYRIVIAATQPAGEYSGLVTYRATATF